jgi:GT2 family glycosyltransferase
VTVVIVNFNAGALLADCVRAVLISTVPVRVWVVDNGSTDGSLRAVEQLLPGHEGLHLLSLGENLGFAVANNRVLERLSTPYALLLNPDCVVAPDTLERMLEVMEARPRVGLAGCMVRNPDGSEQRGCRRRIPTPWSSLAQVTGLSRLRPGRAGFDRRGSPLPDAPVEVEAVSGAFMLVRRAALQQVGLLDEGYFLHCEDLDWFVRFRRQGWGVLLVPGVEVVHHQGTCSYNRPVRVEWHKHRGMLRFYRKFQSRGHALPLRWLIAVGVWLRFALVGLRSLLPGGGGARR